MSDGDEKDPPPIASLHDARNKRAQANGLELHARGLAYASVEYVFDDDTIGVLPNGHIMVVIDQKRLVGIQMTPASANQLAQALLGAALVAHPEDECGSPTCPFHSAVPPAG